MQDTTSLLESAKTQLVEVKQQYKELDGEIRVLSRSIYDYETKIAQKAEALKDLVAQEEALARDCDSLGLLDEKLKINDGLNSELDQIESEIKNYYVKIDQAKATIDSSLLKAKQEEEAALKNARSELAAKQKRLTVMNTDSYTEDIYYWYQQAQSLLQGIFGTLDVQMVENKVVFKIMLNQAQIDVTLSNRKMEMATLSGSPSDEMIQRFHEYKNHCVQINNMLLLVAKTFLLD